MSDFDTSEVVSEEDLVDLKKKDDALLDVDVDHIDAAVEILPEEAEAIDQEDMGMYGEDRALEEAIFGENYNAL